MPETNINIHLKLFDEFSANMQKFQNNLQKTAQRGIEVGRTMKMVGREISQLGMTMMWTGTAMTAPLIAAFKSAEQYSIKVSREISKMNDAFISLRVSIAEALLPTMHQVTRGLQAMFSLWNSLTPATQQMIVNTIMVTGAMIALAGVITMVIGRVVRMIGVVISLGSKFAAFALLHPVLLGIALAIGALIFLMMRFKDVGTSVMNALEITCKTLSIGFWTVINALVKGFDWVLSLLEGVYNQLQKLPRWLGGGMFADALAGVKELRGNVQQFSQDIEFAMNELALEINRIVITGKGDWTKAFDDIKAKIQEMFAKLKEGADKTAPAVAKSFDMMAQATRGVAQQMENDLATFLFNPFSENVKTAKEMFADFGRSMLQMLTQLIAKWMVYNMVKSMFPGLLKFLHKGGVVRAHSGYLAQDEVPIIAQAGEGVLSRRGMAALGRENFDRLNRGESRGGGGVSITINPFMQLWDASDIQRNKSILIAAMNEAIKNNSAIRKIIKEYG